jgi:hypothetical protein
MLPQKLKEYESSGIVFNRDGMLNLPIYGQFSSVSTLNIIPVDWVVKMMANLTDLKADGHVFHIVHPNPPRIQWLNDVSLSHMGISNFCYGKPPSGLDPKSLLGRFQKIFDRSTAQYLPYIMHEAKFEALNLQCVLGEGFIAPPPVDELFVTKLMDYAKSVNFGTA